MSRLVIRLVISAAALWAAALLVDGITVTNDIVGLLIVALIFGLINAIIKPIVDLFTCPVYILTLGLFTFVVNALMLMLTSALSEGRLVVNGFWAAFFGGIVISVVSTLLSLFLSDDK
ncbi:MAG: phage holin family protein [Caldilineaceae bacterium]|nr:phage holin family protein [Caldilineaceae bacterium]MCB0124549.1 phage holin family protein [Caldilineaceae bacterium]HRW03719.1 phage holin family protein [Caldilineaceae bacterium]